MTKIQQKTTKSKSKLIPYGKYCIDSFKLLIDQKHFTLINIPDTFTLISSDGDIIDEFKKNSIPVKYNDTTIYIGKFRKILKQQNIDKVVLLFSSKIDTQGYFNGITREKTAKVLGYLKEIGRIDYNDVNSIINNMTYKDCDIKTDFEYKGTREELNEQHKALKQFFNGSEDNIKTFDNKKGDGVGLQANFRKNSSYTKPFIKFYEKSIEIQSKHSDFLSLFSTDLYNEVVFCSSVYRYEYTIKDKDYCKKFNITNKLSDLFDLSQEKLREIGKYMYDANFGLLPKKLRETVEMGAKDIVLARMFFKLHKMGVDVNEIKQYFTDSGDKKNCHTNRQVKLFERIYYYVVEGHAKEIQGDVDRVENWYKMLGF